MYKYHYSVGMKSFGPITLNQLKRLSPFEDTMVWLGGLRDWVKVEELEELERLFKTVPLI
jgi:hypothetical protein